VKKPAIAVTVLAALVLVYLMTSEYAVAPPWELLVLDAAGNAVSDVQVTEFWVGPDLRSEVRKTDSAGKVMFPRRSVRGGLLVRIWVEARQDAIRKSETPLLGHVPCIRVTDPLWHSENMACADVGARDTFRSEIQVTRTGNISDQR